VDTRGRGVGALGNRILPAAAPGRRRPQCAPADTDVASKCAGPDRGGETPATGKGSSAIGEKALKWRRSSDREATTLADATELVGGYRCRWEFEMFHNILKRGPNVEVLQLSAMSRIGQLLAWFMIVAWRIDYLMRQGLSCPELDCVVVFEREDWQAAWLVASKPMPRSLNDAIHLIASSADSSVAKAT